MPFFLYIWIISVFSTKHIQNWSELEENILYVPLSFEEGSKLNQSSAELK